MFQAFSLDAIRTRQTNKKNNNQLKVVSWDFIQETAYIQYALVVKNFQYSCFATFGPSPCLRSLS